MEKVYKNALETILALCEKNGYLNDETVKVICETALKEREEQTNDTI